MGNERLSYADRAKFRFTLNQNTSMKKVAPCALDSFLVGHHHRIAHAALVEWLVRNQKF